MTTTQRRRLKKLADHLVGGKLGHRHFDFVRFNSFPDDYKGPLNTCGTSGCAVGECPIVFPRSWEFRETDGSPRLRAKKKAYGTPIVAACRFFGLGLNEARHLFLPNCSLGRRPGPGPMASAAQVGRHILRFLGYKETAE